MPLEDIPIEDLLPHRDGMLLIDAIITYSEEKAVTRSVASAHWPLMTPDGIQALVLVELAAQTAGINNGLQIRLRQGPNADHRGWIVGIKNARFYIDVLPLGTEIIVSSENQFAFEGFREIAAEATVNGLPAATIILQLMQAEQD